MMTSTLLPHLDPSYDAFRGLPPGSRLMIAFSGGIDSTIAAYICREAGYEIEAVNMRLLHGASVQTEKIDRAAKKLGINVHYLDLAEDFQELIMRYCWNEFDAGRTPNPCAVCNPLFKFGRLIQFALECGCAGLVTGHYARILSDECGGFCLARGCHRAKDQSYFLFGLSTDQIAHTYMPLGAMTKDTVRTIARELELPNADAPESQDACFAPKNGSLAEMLCSLFHGSPKKGHFVDAATGKILGDHKGIHAYTIGQRKGTGVATGKPVYVSRIHPDSYDIELSSDPKVLETSILELERPNFLSKCYAQMSEFRADVQIRYRSRPAPADIFKNSDNSFTVQFDQPQRAVTPGQAAVFYKDDCLIGGAWIKSGHQ